MVECDYFVKPIIMKTYILVWELIGYEPQRDHRLTELRQMFEDDPTSDVVVSYGGLPKLAEWEENENLGSDWFEERPKVGNVIIVPPALDVETRNQIRTHLEVRGILDAYGATVYGYPVLNKETLVQSSTPGVNKV